MCRMADGRGAVATSGAPRWRSMLLVLATLVLPAAAQTWQIPGPSPGLMPNSSLGRMLYGKHCATCHGSDLKGSDKGPPFPHRVYRPSHHADAAFQLAARNGVNAGRRGPADVVARL